MHEADQVPVLEIESLDIAYVTRAGPVKAVRDVSLEIRSGDGDQYAPLQHDLQVESTLFQQAYILSIVRFAHIRETDPEAFVVMAYQRIVAH